MATPYFQLRVDRVTSTQDVARAKIEELPLLVLAPGQTRGRGRSGSAWIDAPRALAVSLAFRHAPDDGRPISLMAGVAALAATEGTKLKWPNDLMREGLKVGGILVERAGDVTVVGLGLNLWWPGPPQDIGSLHREDPGDDVYAGTGALWGAGLMELIDGGGWPISIYREACDTIGRDVTWEPGGAGRAVDIDIDGGLIVETARGREVVHAGAVRHIR